MRQVEKSFLEGKEKVAEGYKIFTNNWGTKHSDLTYGDVKVGNVYTVDGNIKECNWGLHFSINPMDCFNFYECVKWNKFAKVTAYDQIIKRDDKCVTNIIEISEIYTFDEFVKIIKSENLKISSEGINTILPINTL